MWTYIQLIYCNFLSAFCCQMGVRKNTLPDGAHCWISERFNLRHSLTGHRLSVCIACVQAMQRSGYQILEVQMTHIPGERPIQDAQTPIICAHHGCNTPIFHRALCQCPVRMAEKYDTNVQLPEFDERVVVGVPAVVVPVIEYIEVVLHPNIIDID